MAELKEPINIDKETLRTILKYLKQFETKKENEEMASLKTEIGKNKEKLESLNNLLKDIFYGIAGAIPDSRVDRNGKYKGYPESSVEAAGERMRDRLENLTGNSQLTADYDYNLVDYLEKLAKIIRNLGSNPGNPGNPQTPGGTYVKDAEYLVSNNKKNHHIKISYSNGDSKLLDISDLVDVLPDTPKLEYITEAEFDALWKSLGGV